MIIMLFSVCTNGRHMLASKILQYLTQAPVAYGKSTSRTPTRLNSAVKSRRRRRCGL